MRPVPAAARMSLLASLTVATIWLQAVAMDSCAADPEAAERALPANCSTVDNDPFKTICVCDEHQCDSLLFDWPTEKGQAWMVETTRSGLRFSARRLPNVTHRANVTSAASATSSGGKIRVNLDVQQQEVLGWGGAFTDSASINIQSLSAKVRERLIESYFGPTGLQYNFGRVPVGGSDFSTRAYSYDDCDHLDLNLTKFALAEEDLTYKIPTIKQAMEAAKVDGTVLKLFASPWSPPKWMKTSNSFKRGFLLDRHDVRESYAKYLVKFFQSYKDHGLDFWGATVQNEPMAAYLPLYYFNSLQMGSSETVEFIANHLGPALESAGYTKQNFKLMIGDDSLGLVNMLAPAIMRDSRVQKYVSGLAFHWYLSGMLVPYDLLNNVVHQLGDKIEFVMMTEACQGFMRFTKHVDLGDWSRAESYASDIIEDFRRKTGAWIDWNLALDPNGGPNWAGNFVDSPVIVDKARNEFIKQPMYYVLAQFTKFMRPGSVVVESSTHDARGLSVVAAQLKDAGQVVVAVLNTSSSKRQVSLEVSMPSSQVNQSIIVDNVELEPKSVSTIIVKL